MKHKKLLSLVTGLALMASALTVSAEAPYTDLGTMSNRDGVDYLYDTHCLTFITGTTFEPQAVLTRGELAQLVYNAAANLPLSNPAFTDVQPGSAADAMAAVSAQGILAGYADGSFRPDEPVTREEFATVIYKYLQYIHMADSEETASPYADEQQVMPSAAEAVRVLHSKNIMVPADNLFRPKEGITREDAVNVVYHLLHSDKDYVSHVQVEAEVMKALNAEYGSVIAYFRQGTMYWNGDTLVLGMIGSPSRNFATRIKNTVTRSDAVVIRRVHLSRNDYDQILNRAVNSLVETEGVQNYVGAVPDYIHEQVVITVHRPVSEATIAALLQRVGSGLVRIETVPVAGKQPQVQDIRGTSAAPAGNTDQQPADRGTYAPLVDPATAQTITAVQKDTIKH